MNKRISAAVYVVLGALLGVAVVPFCLYCAAIVYYLVIK